MKMLIAAITALTLTGCAGKWDEYAATNHCAATPQTMQKPVAEFSSGGSFTGAASVPSQATSVRFQSYRLYQCSNGSIWGPV